MMRTILFAILLSPIALSAQIKEADLAKLQTAEMNLRDMALAFATAPTDTDAINLNYQFIPQLVTALKVENSFEYPFDSLVNIVIHYPDDRSFRVITWQLQLRSGIHRYFGAIQMKSKELELIPLVDKTDKIRSPEDTTLDAKCWYGGVYYKILQTKHKGTTYYTFLGYDGNDLWSHKKFIEVWTLDKGKFVMGVPVFELTDEYQQNRPENITRFIHEFKFDAKLPMNWSEEDNMIVFGHTIPEQEEASELGFSRVPDGTYDGFKWENGKWVLYENIYDMSPQRKDPPTPNPVLGEDKQ